MRHLKFYKTSKTVLKFSYYIMDKYANLWSKNGKKRIDTLHICSKSADTKYEKCCSHCALQLFFWPHMPETNLRRSKNWFPTNYSCFSLLFGFILGRRQFFLMKMCMIYIPNESSWFELQLFSERFIKKFIYRGQKNRSLTFTQQKFYIWCQRMIFLTNFFKSGVPTPKEKVIAREASYPKMWLMRSVADFDMDL